jgi:NDP-sugar pyrophosphorylase family protein
MKAIILAAGLGSRLNKLTFERPKALVEVNGITMLESLIKRLKSQGVTEFLINIHHHGQKIIDFLKHNNNFGAHITLSDERDILLNTGGAILKAKDFIAGNKPVLVHNVDILSNTSIDVLEKYHIDNRSIATLCIRKRETQRGLLFNNSMNLIGWMNKSTNQFRWVDKKQHEFNKFAFSGIYMIDPEFITELRFTDNFSIIDAWLDIANRKTIMGYVDNSSLWHDLGTIEKIKTAQRNT